MNVGQLIEKLRRLPSNAQVLRATGEYAGSTGHVTHVVHYKEASLEAVPNTVILS